MKTITHVLAHEGIEIEIGLTKMSDNQAWIQETRFNDVVHVDNDIEIHCDKIATMQTPGDSEIYMYKVYDTTTWENDYYIVNHLPYWERLHGQVVYATEITYHEKMQADNDLDAFREFAKEMENHM